MFNPYKYGLGSSGVFDPFGSGGITWQIDNLLRAAQDAVMQDDARLYANIVSQVCVACAPKMSPEDYSKYSQFEVEYEHDPSMSKRDNRRAYEAALFESARNNLAQVLRLMSSKGLYAKKDEAPEEPVNEPSLALK